MIILVARGRGRGGRGKGRGGRGKGRGTRGRSARGGARGVGTSDLRRSNRVKKKDHSYNAEEEVEEVEEEVILAFSQQIAFKPSSALLQQSSFQQSLAQQFSSQQSSSQQSLSQQSSSQQSLPQRSLF